MTDKHLTQETPLSRRTAIKATVLAATALIALRQKTLVRAEDDPPFDPGGRIRVDYDETVSFNEKFGYPPMLGRNENRRLQVFKEADEKSRVVRGVKYDEVLPIFASIDGKPPRGFRHNAIWYDVGEGYVHSSYVVPVREVYNQPEWETGFWGEITVPTSWQHWQPKLRSRRYYDLAYGSIYRVIGRVDETDGRAWYRIVDDMAPSSEWWIQARHVRHVQPDEFAPISPDVPPQLKRIDVSIGQQLLTCYEGSNAVFSTRIASGASFKDAQGQVHLFGTPYGEHRVVRKMPSRHMVGGENNNDRYDLPGVPWCTFFTSKGAAIHAAYWHNDFGRPRSHGCVNVSHDAAQWIYRWTIPYAGYAEDIHKTAQEDRDLATIVNVQN